jgi:hypothetical protein
LAVMQQRITKSLCVTNGLSKVMTITSQQRIHLCLRPVYKARTLGNAHMTYTFLVCSLFIVYLVNHVLFCNAVSSLRYVTSNDWMISEE